MAETSRPREAPRGRLWVPWTIALLHVLGWGALLGAVLPAQLATGASAGPLLALSFAAYALGIRHAFDADHVAAIDNATRQLVARGRHASTTGFWFALGHSTVVLLAVVFIAGGASTLSSALTDDGSALRQDAALWGGSVSGVFLLATAILNLPALAALTATRRRRRSEQSVPDREDIAAVLDRRGVLFRLLRPMTQLVGRPSRMYPVGFLFGLGLDTAASITLFALAGTFTRALPWYAVVVLPILLTAGMTLFDTLDGVLVTRVYRFASFNPTRSLDHNIITTGVSVGLAFVVGTTGLLSVLVQLLDPGFSLIPTLGSLDVNILGLAAVVFFTLVWAATTILRKRRGHSKAAGSLL